VQFDLTSDQRDLLGAVGTLLSRFAGPGRCRALGGSSPDYDHDLDAAMAAAGFLGIAAEQDGGPLEAALVGEAVAAAAGVMSYGAAALVATGIGASGLHGPIALTTSTHRGPVRYAAQARTLLVLDGDVTRIVDVEPGTFASVPSRFGYPFGRIDDLPTVGRNLDGGSGTRMLAWWRLALAVEMVGTLIAALELTVAYTREREQFGRAIGSFQAVQHRLAELTMLGEGARWLARETAWRGAPDDAAALALVHATSVARRIPTETHQLTGAVGFAAEYDLHLWTMRLPALLTEAAWLQQAASTADGGMVVARWAPADR
jgi:alkylation response protein AidB-like acyl-CoA dehydrogenase